LRSPVQAGPTGDDRLFNFLDEGEVRDIDAPEFREGNKPAVDPNPNDPLD